MTVWLAEVWCSWRASLRRPGFLLLASGVLALGIGASVAVFALIDNTLLRPLPVPRASQLVAVGKVRNGQVRWISPLQYQHLASLEGVESIGLQQLGMAANVTEAGAPEQVPAIHADRGVLPTLGLHAIMGRNFSADEDRPNGPQAVLLGHGFWQRRYGADPAVVGRSLQVEGVAHTIVGVLPAAFSAVEGPADIVLPMALPVASQQDAANYTAIARLAGGVSVAAASAQIDARLRAMYRAMGYDNQQSGRFGAEDFAAWKHQGAWPILILFLACGFFVLLIALVNLTNLMLLRSMSRNHDAAVRSALGASRLRLMLPALGEGLLVGGCSAVLGMALAFAGLALLQGFIPAEWLEAGHVRVGAAAWVLAFGLGLLGALLAAALALWRSRSTTTVDELREGGRSGIGVRSGRLGRALVVVQVALAVILLCAAGVFMHALYDASQVRLSFVGDNILTFDLAPVKTVYPDAASMERLSQRLVQRLREIPGVTDAAVTTNLPSSVGAVGQLNSNVDLPSGFRPDVQYHGVDSGFFKLFSIALRQGRAFARDDVRGSEPIAVVSQNLADRIDGGDALGKLVQVEGNGDAKWPVRIVGVVADTYQDGPLYPQQMVLYVPLTQMPASMLAVFRSIEPLRFALRGHGNPADWRAEVHKALAEVAPGQPIANLRSMRSIVRQTTASAQLSMLLIGLFASLALLLAAAGLYAVMSVAVAAREREFGVRMALGSSAGRLARQVLRGGLVQIVVGLVLGVAVASGASHAPSSLLMTLLGRGNAFDPAVALGVCAVLAVAGLLACLLPALRAGRVHPMRALRGE